MCLSFTTCFTLPLSPPTSLSLISHSLFFFPFNKRGGLETQDLKHKSFLLNRAKAAEKLIAANKQHDCLQPVCATPLPTQNEGWERSGGPSRGSRQYVLGHTWSKVIYVIKTYAGRHGFTRLIWRKEAHYHFYCVGGHWPAKQLAVMRQNYVISLYFSGV